MMAAGMPASTSEKTFSYRTPCYSRPDCPGSAELSAHKSCIEDLINTARLALNLTPLKRLLRGIPLSSTNCVLGRSLRSEFLLDDQDQPFVLVLNHRKARKLAAAWSVERPRAVWNGWSVGLPHELCAVLNSFDAGQYPELISEALTLETCRH